MKTTMKTIAILSLLGLFGTGVGMAITSSKATTIMSTATGLIGSPYKWGEKGPTSFDCSGLTWYCYNKARITIPQGSMNQFNACNMSVRTTTKAALLFFATDSARPGTVTHVTLNCGDGAYSIGANGPGSPNKVEKFKFTSSYWKSKLITCATNSRW